MFMGVDSLRHTKKEGTVLTQGKCLKLLLLLLLRHNKNNSAFDSHMFALSGRQGLLLGRWMGEETNHFQEDGIKILQMNKKH